MLAPSVSKEDQPFPDDVLLNIFIRLQARLVAQMRRVSKSLNAFFFLSQPSFIKSHLNCSILNNDKIPLVFYCPFLFDELVRFPAKLEFGFIIIGSINGLVCVSSYSSGKAFIHIWNPSLSALLALTPSNDDFSLSALLSLSPSNDHFDPWGFHCLVRFGFDPKTDDYKVVNLKCLGREIIGRPRGAICSCKKCLHVEVYSMRKGCWHSITQRFPSHVTRIHYQYEVCVDGLDGHVYWLGDLGEERKLQTIVVFDFCGDFQCDIALPDSVAYDNENYLAVLAKNLFLLSSDREGQSEIWKIDKYGVAESWVKHHIFPHNCGIVRPTGFTSSNEFLMTSFLQPQTLMTSNNKFTASYNLNTAKVTYIEKDKLHLEPPLTLTVWYIDSLVWVSPPKCSMGWKDGLHNNFIRWIGSKGYNWLQVLQWLPIMPNFVALIQLFFSLISGGTGEKEVMK